jgi:hypothetical protein
LTATVPLGLAAGPLPFPRLAGALRFLAALDWARAFLALLDFEAVIRATPPVGSRLLA